MNTTRTETEVIDRINAITLEETNALMRQTLAAPHSVASICKTVGTFTRLPCLFPKLCKKSITI